MFYFDVGSFLIKNGLKKIGLQLLTSLLEIDLANIQYKRIIAAKFEELGLIDYAINLYERILKQRPEEPQSYRDLAITLVKRGNLSDYQKALKLLTKIIKEDWDIRFTQVEVIALMELSRIYKDLDISAIVQCDELYSILQQYPIRLDVPLQLDLRIVMCWDTDIVDIELHVVEPNGEECYSFHNHTTSGGMMSKDMSGGLGPEEYTLRYAPEGLYKLYVKLFSKKGRNVGFGVTVQVRIYTKYGTPDIEKEYLHFVRLQDEKESIHVANIRF